MTTQWSKEKELTHKQRSTNITTGCGIGCSEGKTVQLTLVIRDKGRPNLLKVKACNC